MGTPTPPQPVKLFLALLSTDPYFFTTATFQLQQSYGSVDLESEVFPWNTTDYYREEMGENLRRKFVTFERLLSLKNSSASSWKRTRWSYPCLPLLRPPLPVA
jgi:hypothetical protein